MAVKMQEWHNYILLLFSKISNHKILSSDFNENLQNEIKNIY